MGTGVLDMSAEDYFPAGEDENWEEIEQQDNELAFMSYDLMDLEDE